MCKSDDDVADAISANLGLECYAIYEGSRLPRWDDARGGIVCTSAACGGAAQPHGRVTILDTGSYVWKLIFCETCKWAHYILRTERMSSRPAYREHQEFRWMERGLEDTHPRPAPEEMPF